MFLASAALGRLLRIATLDLDSDAAAWLAAVGLHEGEELVVLRRAALGGPVHVRTASGGEFAVARELAARIAVAAVVADAAE
jgi:ferrous iron transport protein A